MFKFFFALVAVTTVISMGVIGKIGKVGTEVVVIKPAPMIIEASGAVSFPGRVPKPQTVYELRRAIQMEDVEALNTILVKNHLFVAPNN